MFRLLNAAFLSALVALAALGVQASPAAAAATTTRPAYLVGQLGFEGGAYPGGFHPTAGTVDVEFRNLPLVLVKQVGPSGNFEIRLGAGSYTVIGCGPSASGGPSGQCSRPLGVTLRPGEIDHVRLIWAYAP